jgi:hypothetical protein
MEYPRMRLFYQMRKDEEKEVVHSERTGWQRGYM